MKTHFRPERSRERRLADREAEGASPRLVPRESSRKAPVVPPAQGRRKIVRRPGIDLRPDYRLTLLASLALVLTLLVAAFRIEWSSDGATLDITLSEQEVVQMEEIQQTQQVQRPPPPPRPPVPVEVPDDRILDDVDLDLDASLDLDEPVSTLPPPPPAPPSDDRAIEEPEPEIFVVVEQMPEIIGGSQKVYEYLEYPPIARQAGMEGLVVIQIVVSPQGVPTDPIVVRSAGEVLDRAAADAVMKLRFVPGKQRGRAVSVRMAIPIRFRLKDAGGRS